MDRPPFAGLAVATYHRHRFALPDGRVVEVDVITCSDEEWDDCPERSSGQWSTFRVAARVEAVRLTL